MPANTARRHPDYPVEIKGEFAKRVQSVSLNKNIPTQAYDELGNSEHAGVAQESGQFTGELTWFPVDNSTELLLRGLASNSGSSISLQNLIDLSNGVTIKNPLATLTGAQVVSLEYSVSAPSGEFRATARLKGTSWADATNTITVTDPSGVACYKSKDVTVSVNGTTGVRVSGLTIRADMPNQDLYELNNANPVATVFDTPNVTCDIDFYESSAIAGATELALASPGDIVVTISTAKKITCKNMVFKSKDERGTVRGWATRRYSYESKGDSTTNGLLIEVPA